MRLALLLPGVRTLFAHARARGEGMRGAAEALRHGARTLRSAGIQLGAAERTTGGELRHGFAAGGATVWGSHEPTLTRFGEGSLRGREIERGGLRGCEPHQRLPLARARDRHPHAPRPHLAGAAA